MPVATDILSPHAIVRLEDDAVVLLDQRRLPAEAVELRLATWQQVADAIREMAVRGRARDRRGRRLRRGARRGEEHGRERRRCCARMSARAAAGLAAARPTAVNLPWAVERMVEEAALAASRPGGRCGMRCGREPRRSTRTRSTAAFASASTAPAFCGRERQVLTHCNAGALATGGFGTALGIIRAAHRRDPGLHVWVDETRPLLQGARLTAWELQQEDIAATLITDSTAGLAHGRAQGRRGHHRAPTGSPETATRRTRSAPTAWPCSPALTACRSTSPRPRRPSTRASRAAREIPIEHRRGDEVAAGARRGRRRLQPGLRRHAGRVRERDRHRARRAPAAVPVHLSAPDVRELLLRLARHGQEHLLRFWDELDDGERARLAADIGQIDLDLVDGLVATLLERAEPIDPGDDRGARGRAAGAAGRARGPRCAGGGGGGGRDRRRRAGDAPRASTARRAATRSARSPTGRCSRSTPRRWSRSGRRHGVRCPCT